MTSLSDSPAPTEANESEEPDPIPPKRRLPALVWSSSTYFAEGFPYTLVNNLVEVLFVELGASLAAVGLTSLFHLPYNLKFLWAPLLDGYGNKRQWMVGLQLFLATAMVVLAAVVPLDSFALLSLAFIVLAVGSATQDIAIDGYYLDALSTEDQARYVGVRAPAYRAGILLAGGPLLVAIGTIGWTAGFLVCAAVMGLLALIHAWGLPSVPGADKGIGALLRPGRGGWVVIAVVLALASVPLWPQFTFPLTVREVQGAVAYVPVILAIVIFTAIAFRPLLVRRLDRLDSPFATAFSSFLTQRGATQILLFVVCFRVGESFLQKMRYPFLKGVGMTIEQYGWAKGTLGLLASIVAPAIGGIVIAKWGLRRFIWPFVLAQNVLNLLYAALAYWSVGRESVPLALSTFVITAEMFGAGLGTAVFMVFLMRCCQPDHRASHYAILSAIMSLGFTIAGSLSGFIVEGLGGDYGTYFVLTFIATVPGMLLIFGLPNIDEPKATSPSASSA